MGTTSKLILQVVIYSLCLLCFFACDSFNDSKPKASKNLTIESSIEVAEQSVSIMGGKIVVDYPGSKIDGMEIMVPANSYLSSRTFTISTADIANHNLGANFNPISPLIMIENGGAYANQIMEITIPISISNGEIPLAFFYNEIDGTLESIPTKSYNNSSITILTRHFMSASDFDIDEELNKSSKVPVNAVSKLVVSSLSESLINATPIISSGFNVGTDDWEFTNYGSYIASGGHCAGQNMAAMWYYYEQKLKGESPLFGRFSTHDNMWQDNAIGYKFCSVIHADLEWDGNIAILFGKYIDKNQELDRMKFNTIAGAMFITGEPQGIGIYRQIGTYTDGSPKYGGHDLICYKIAPNEGKLFISDPNEPGNGQTILLKNNKFEPYIAKENGEAASHPYPFVTYYAKTAYIDWNKISKRYTELLDSSIGYVPPSDFPDYQIKVKHKNEYFDFWDGITISNDTLRCVVDCPTAELFYNIDNNHLIGFSVYNEQGQFESIKKTEWEKYVLLKPGLNKLGFYIYGWRSNSKYDNGEYINKFIDFKWFKVYNSKLTIEPNPIEAELDEEIEFEALFEGALPASVKYVWDFGDGKKKQTVLDDNTITYKYKKEGEYEITLELYDNNKNQLIDKVSAQAKIIKTSGDLAKLKKSKHVDVRSTFEYYASKREYEHSGAFQFIRSNKDNIQWSGNSFTLTQNYEDSDNTGYKTIWTETVSGTVSNDAKKLITFTLDSKRDYYYSNEWRTTDIEKITLNDVPISKGYANYFTYALDDKEITSHISNFTYGIYGLQWDSEIRKYVEYDWRWDKSHIINFSDTFTIGFFETIE